MTATRYPLDPLFAVLTERGVTSVRDACRALGVDPRDFYRWRLAGVTERRADSLAVAIGLTPGAIWPEWVEADRRLVEDAEAKRRALAAAAKRRLRATSPAYRERQRASNRRYYEEAGDYLRARGRATYWADPERQRERKRSERARSRAS